MPASMRKPVWMVFILGLMCMAATDAGAVDTLLGCRKLGVKLTAVDASLARITWSCPTPGTPLPLPIPDPVSGIRGSLVLSDPTGAPIYAGLFLPSSGWRLLGPADAPNGYRFTGFVSGVDHLFRCGITLAPKGIKARCLGPVNIPMPVAGTVSVELAIAGQGHSNYCAEFGGTKVLDSAMALVRKNSAAPAACPPIF